MTGLRGRISQAIAKLPSDCHRNDAFAELEPLFATLTTNEMSSSDREGVSPLMVACDRGSVACLDYLVQKGEAADDQVVTIIGSPTEKSEGDLNTALHHAAMSGCSYALPAFNRMGHSPMVLGAARNSHGDNPLMMAAASGHEEFIKRWYEISVREDTVSDAHQVLNAQNHSGDSPLSLSCGHGHKAVVEFLLDCDIFVKPEILEKCKDSFSKMETAVKRSSALKELQPKLDSVKACISKIELVLAQKADDAAMALMETELSIARVKQLPAKKKKAKAKTKKAAGSTKADSEFAAHDTNSSNLPCKGGDSVSLTTLTDGTVAVCVEGREEVAQPHPGMISLPAQPSAEQMFRDRFEGVSSEVDSVMESLCLDLSMLLYTPHGMALNLSPSQLDAVQGILERQLRAVAEAKAIKSRMHTLPPSNSSSS